MRDQDEGGKAREHLDEGKWRDIGRGYSNGMYERLKSCICREKVAETGHSFLAAEKDMLGDDEGEAAMVELAAGKGKTA